MTCPRCQRRDAFVLSDTSPVCCTECCDDSHKHNTEYDDAKLPTLPAPQGKPTARTVLEVLLRQMGS